MRTMLFVLFLLSLFDFIKPVEAQVIQNYPPVLSIFDSTASQTVTFGALLQRTWADSRYQVEIRYQVGESRIFIFELQREVGDQYLVELPYFAFDREDFEYRIAIYRCFFWCGYERTGWQQFSVLANSNTGSSQYTVEVDIEPDNSDVVFALQEAPDLSSPVILYGSTAPVAGVLTKGTYYFQYITSATGGTPEPTSVTITIDGETFYSGDLVNNLQIDIPTSNSPPPPPEDNSQPPPPPPQPPQEDPQPQPNPPSTNDPDDLCAIDPNAYNICLDLNLDSSTSSAARSFFVSAKAQWEKIIVGDIPDFSVPAGSTLGLRNDAGPLLQSGQITILDDLYIHARVRFIDGRGRVLGQAAPLRGQTDPATGFYYAKVGIMEFDSADLDSSFESVILHEMAHVIGIGSLWRANGIYRDPTYLGKNANREYQQLVGDTTGSKTVPIEQDQGGRGTVDSHWDEGCLRNEIMTGFLNGGSQPISRITIGGMEDLGLKVDYSQASSFSNSQTNPSECRRNGGRQRRSLRVRHLPQSTNYRRRQLGLPETPDDESSPEVHHHHRRLSNAELETAECYGMQVLREHRKNMQGVKLPEGIVDLGSQETEVLMLSSEGDIVAVHVEWNDNDIFA